MSEVNFKGDYIRVVFLQEIEEGEIVTSKMSEFDVRKPSDGNALERIVWISKEYPNGDQNNE